MHNDISVDRQNSETFREERRQMMRCDIFLGTVELFLKHQTPEQRLLTLDDIAKNKDCYVPREYEKLCTLITENIYG